MKYRYHAARRRLYVSHPDRNLISLYSVLRVWRLSGKLDAIVYMTDEATWIFRGPHLARLLSDSDRFAMPATRSHRWRAR